MNYYQPARYSYSCYSMVSFGRKSPNIIYNYLYISNLYIIYENQRTQKLIVTTVTVTSSAKLSCLIHASSTRPSSAMQISL